VAIGLIAEYYTTSTRGDPHTSAATSLVLRL
jgi:hypothetical protein